MTDPSREIEAKFELDDEDRERLTALERAGRFRVAGRETLNQVDLYFDTPTVRLARAKSTVRVRWNEHGAFMTFKGRRETVGDDAHVATRLEDEVELSPEFLAQVAIHAPLPDDASLSPLVRAREIVGDEPLLAICRIENARLALDLRDDVDAALELAVDRCRATRLSDGRVSSWDEVEIETKSGGRGALAAAVAALTAAVPSLRPNHRTKLERALG